MKSPVNILIVEDEAIIAVYLELLLREAGYTVTAIAPSGEEAIQCAEANLPDLAFMDVNLVGGMDGVEVAEYLETQYAIPVIYLSAYTADQLRKRVNPARPFRYLPKFFHPAELIQAIEDALAGN